VRLVRAFVRTLLWPVRRFFDPRFQGIALHVETAGERLTRQAEVFHTDLVRHLDAAAETRARGQDQEAAFRERAEVALGDLRTMLTDEMEASSEATTVIGQSLSDLLGEADRLRNLIEAYQGDAISDSYVERVVGSDVDALDEGLAKILDYAGGHRGFAAQQNLWFNPPLVVKHEGGDVRVAVVNERIAEGPYVMRALASLAPGARVLDVGAAESTLAFSLATLGYRVTALDLHPYPLQHPNLQAVEAAVQDWKAAETFEAVICLSTIEHIGLGAYGEAALDEGADLEAMRRIRELTAPGGLLVLTAPFGPKGQTEVQRIYDGPALKKLLEGWDIEDLTVVRHVDPTTWVVADASSSENGEHVALATARRA
jgi:SAM-dependent methyltransferase